MRRIDYPMTVPFHDVDSMQIVWHGRYVKYFEVARCELLDSFGYGYEAMRDSGYAWPVVDMRIKYYRPVRFNQKIVVEATVAEWENRLKVSYLIRDAASGERLTTGYTIQVAVSLESQEMLFESPKVLLERLGVPA